MNTVASSEQFPLQPESEFKLLKITFFLNWHITWTSESMRNQSTESVESRFNLKYQYFKLHH